MRECIIFGCGDVGKEVYLSYHQDFNFVAASDNNQSLWGKLFADTPLAIIPPEDIHEIIGDDGVVIVASGNYFFDIACQLHEMKLNFMIYNSNELFDYDYEKKLVIAEGRKHNKTDQNVINNIPVLAFSPNPHGETVLMCGRENYIAKERELDLTEFCTYHGLNMFQRNGSVLFSTLKIEKDKNGLEYIYGGKAFNEKHGLIIGTADVDAKCIDIREIKENCGEFHLLTFSNEGGEFSADYFGYQPLIHYSRDGFHVISTSYHLLLLMLKVIGEPLEVNLPHVYEMIKQNEKQKHFSELSIEMKDCRCNKPYEYFILCNNTLKVCNSTMFEAMYDEISFSEKDYESLIFEARNDIVNHTRMVFEYPAFDKVIVDLTGGFDSRMCYAACTVLPDSLIRQKIQLNSRKSPDPNDMETAVSINTLYKYPYIQNLDGYRLIPNYREFGDMLFANNISKSLGTYKTWNCWALAESYRFSNVAHIYGGCGDVYHGIGWLWLNFMDLMHYTNNRNRFHFRKPFTNAYPVLMSKNAFKAALMIRRHYPPAEWMKVSVDITTLINPVLSALPYSNSKIVDFFRDREGKGLYKFPCCEVNYGKKQIAEHTPFYPFFEEISKPENVIYNIGNILTVYDRIRTLSPEIDVVVTYQLGKIIESPIANAGTLSLWWSLFWVLEIIDGNGDFNIIISTTCKTTGL